MARIHVVDSRNYDPAQALRVGGVVFAVLFVLFMINSVYFQVDAEEEGVVTRFGKFERTASPGLHFKLPLFESVQKVPVLRLMKMEFGFRTEEAGVRTQYAPQGQHRAESLMLTGDLGAAEVEWIVQYRIRNSRDYLFNVKDPDNTLRDVSESVMRAVVGDRSVYEVLTVGRDEIRLEVKRKLQEELDRYGAGIAIARVQLQTVGPPSESVKAAFNEVNQSEQEKQRTVNEAMTEYNTVVPKSRGEADREIATAEGYQIERLNRAKGEVARFVALLAEYQAAKEVTRRRLYLETMADVLPNIGPKIIVDEEVDGALPLLHLNAGKSGGGR